MIVDQLTFSFTSSHAKLLRLRSYLGKFGVDYNFTLIRDQVFRDLYEMIQAEIISQCGQTVLYGRVMTIYKLTEKGEKLCEELGIPADDPGKPE